MNDNEYNGKAYAYTAIGLTVAGAVSLGLIFTVLGIYALIASVILQLASLTFTNIQKRKNDFERLKYIRICAYVFLGISIALFAGGIIWSSVNG